MNRVLCDIKNEGLNILFFSEGHDVLQIPSTYVIKFMKIENRD